MSRCAGTSNASPVNAMIPPMCSTRVTDCFDSVLETVKLKTVVHKIPVIGAHLGLGLSLLMVWGLELEPLGGWGLGHTEHWHHIVLNGAVVWGAIPLKDAVVNMVNKGLRA